MARASTGVAACVSGWHYPQEFYEALCRRPELDVYVISHKPRRDIPPAILDLVGESRLWCEPNLGYDWGCYQQFLARGVWREYECVFFLHDDIAIKDFGFIEPVRDLLASGHAVVGNGKPEEPRPWPALTPEVYAHASWKPARDFRHQVVRGSFMAAGRRALEALGCFEVFWDPWRISSGFGNWSLKATCAKWEHRLGEKCFAFLSDDYLTSAYVDEMVRGGEGRTNTWRGALAATALVRWVATWYMRAYWGRQGPGRDAALRLLGLVLESVSGTRRHGCGNRAPARAG